MVIGKVIDYVKSFSGDTHPLKQSGQSVEANFLNEMTSIINNSYSTFDCATQLELINFVCNEYKAILDKAEADKQTVEATEEVLVEVMAPSRGTPVERM